MYEQTATIKPLPTNVDDAPAYQSKWLSADDLRGQTVTVTIENVTYESVRQASGESEDRFILSFVGKTKRFILNKTHVTAVKQIAGSDPHKWRGVRLMLAPGMSTNKKPTLTIFPAQPTQPADKTF